MADVYGRNPVKEVLTSGASVNHIYVAKGAHHKVIDEIFHLAKDKRVPISTVDRKKLDSLFPGQNHQGVYASVAEQHYAEVEDILARAAEKGEAPLILVLDEIEDPHNLGAMLRSADAFGVHGVIIPKRHAAGLTPAATKAAAGADQYVPVARVANISQTLESLKKQGLWICGTALDGKPLETAPLSGPLAVVIGNEGKGVRPLVLKQCDFVVSIPMRGRINSLNASVACGIVLAACASQRPTV